MDGNHHLILSISCVWVPLDLFLFFSPCLSHQLHGYFSTVLYVFRRVRCIAFSTFANQPSPPRLVCIQPCHCHLLTFHLHLVAVRDARALEQLDHGGPNTRTQLTLQMTSNVQLPKLRYPPSAAAAAATATTTTTPVPSIHEYLPVPSVNSSTILHDTSKTSISPDTTPLPPYSPIQPSVDLNHVRSSRDLGMDDRRCVELCRSITVHHWL